MPWRFLVSNAVPPCILTISKDQPRHSVTKANPSHLPTSRSLSKFLERTIDFARVRQLENEHTRRSEERQRSEPNPQDSQKWNIQISSTDLKSGIMYRYHKGAQYRQCISRLFLLRQAQTSDTSRSTSDTSLPAYA